MFDIPTNIVIGDKQFNITDRGDYRMVLDCFSLLNDYELTKEERALGCLMIFYEGIDSFVDICAIEEPVVQELINEMFKFFNCGSEEQNTKNSPRLIDWKKDEQLVCSAVNKVAGTEIRAIPYMHWWTFMGYYMAIGESSLATIVSIRYKIVNNKKLEKYEKDFKAENPQYFNWDKKTVEQHEVENWVLDMWNGGK